MTPTTDTKPKPSPTSPYTPREMKNIPDTETASVRVSGPRFRATVWALDAARCEVEKYRYLLRVVMEERRNG